MPAWKLAAQQVWKPALHKKCVQGAARQRRFGPATGVAAHNAKDSQELKAAMDTTFEVVG
jgi:hypothetical protein